MKRNCLVGAGALALLFLVLVFGPWILTRHPHHGITAEQQLKARNDVRTTLIQAVGAAALMGGLAFTYRTFRLSTSQQMTDRYSTAVEQLGHASIEVRTGAVYALERIIGDSPGDRRTVLAVLSAFLGSRIEQPDTGGSDMAVDKFAAARVIGSWHRPGGDVVTMAGVPMRGARLAGADFSGVDLSGCDLSGAVLSSSRLRGSSLAGSRLCKAVLADSDLSEADLTGADLSDAILTAARLNAAVLTGACLDGASVTVGSLSDHQVRSLRSAQRILWVQRIP